MIPIPIATPQTFALFLLALVTFFIALSFPTVLEVRKPKDAGPRRILESDGKEIVCLGLLSAIFSRENSRSAHLLLEDIEPQEIESAGKGSFFLSLPDVEF